MTAEEFVKAVKIQTSDAGVRGTIMLLRNPPGRKPSEKSIELSRWFNQLSTHNQEQVVKAMTDAAQSAVFSFFCLLDGVAVFEDGPEKGDLRLLYSKGAESCLLNDPAGEFLHNLYSFECNDATS